MAVNITAPRAPGEYECILVPVDLSAHARAAIHHALALAGGDPGKLHLLHVVEAYHPSWKTESVELQRQYRAEARAKFEEFVREEFPSGKRPYVDLVGGHAVEEILHRAEELKPDLLVVGTVGRHGLKRIMIGSVAERIVRYAPCPVLVVR
jgi:nucleotide-binding universal stress UspA family protein